MWFILFRKGRRYMMQLVIKNDFKHYRKFLKGTLMQI